MGILMSLDILVEQLISEAILLFLVDDMMFLLQKFPTLDNDYELKKLMEVNLMNENLSL